jgi:hypothetical protein
MMFKNTLAAATLLASASASQQQDSVKAVSVAAHNAKEHFKTIKTAQNAQTLASLNNFKLANKDILLANKGVSLGARGVSKRSLGTSTRTLRGKGGKGKGRGKDEDEDEDNELSSEPPLYLQMSFGVCAGIDLGAGPITEDIFVSHIQLKSGVCSNSIDTDGFGYSYMMSAMAEPFIVTRKNYLWHGCMAENFVHESDERQWTLLSEAQSQGIVFATPPTLDQV